MIMAHIQDMHVAHNIIMFVHNLIFMHSAIYNLIYRSIIMTSLS